MEFTAEQRSLIAAAKRKAAGATIVRSFIVIALLIGIGLMLAGLLDSGKFAYVAVAAVFLAIVQPQLGGGPKYEDLVALLESKSRQTSSPEG